MSITIENLRRRRRYTVFLLYFSATILPGSAIGNFTVNACELPQTSGCRLLVTAPNSAFQNSAHDNHRFHHKRLSLSAKDQTRRTRVVCLTNRITVFL